jgi:hypothetical protein
MGATNPSLQDVLNAINQVGNKLDEFKTESNDNFRVLSGDIQEIKNNAIAMDSRLTACESNVDQLAYEVECMKQRQLKNNISISGVPFKDDENLLTIFGSVCKAINYMVPNDLIAGIYRTNGVGKQSIIVNLANDAVKFGILAAKKKKKTTILRELDLGYADSNTEIMVNQQLVPYFGNLLFKARQARQRGDIYQCWFSMKGVHIKPTEDSNFIIIKTYADLLPFEKTPSDESNNKHKRKASNEIANNSKKSNDSSNNNKNHPNTPRHDSPRTLTNRPQSSRNANGSASQISTEPTVNSKQKNNKSKEK